MLVFTSLEFFKEKRDEQLHELFAYDVSPPGIVFYFKDHPGFGEASRRFADRFSGRVIVIGTHSVEFHLALCIGGDGSLLWLNQFLDRQLHLPIITINTGHLGFVSQFQTSDIQKVADAIRYYAQGAQGIDSCELFPVSRIHCQVTGSKAGGKIRTAVNEVTLKATDNYYRRFKIFVDDALVVSVNCDGLLVSSQIGSTAYNSSLRGPILTPACEAFVVNVIAPSTFDVPQLILGKGQKLRVELGEDSRPDARVYFDSATYDELAIGQALQIELGPAVFSLVSRNYLTGWVSKIRKLYRL